MECTGVVQKGRGEGAKLGFPTANIPLTDSSVSGVYAAMVIVNSASHSAVAYADTLRGLLEAHILDFSGDLYGATITVVLGEKIRGDARFTTLEALSRQIQEDVAAARRIARQPV